MQVYVNWNKPNFKIILFFLLILIVAYLPISSFLFFLKNDAFTGYFPPKFFISESIHAGYLPLWNPYINYGIPQYGDMSSGFWSPVTWLIASTVGYNAYSLTIELLAYIFAGGVGMYALTGAWQLDKNIRFIAGVAFMCCGFNVGHLQHFNWISGAAFLPWCFWGYLKLLNQFSLTNAITATLVFYLLAASAHPGILIGAIYFFSSLFCFHLFKNSKSSLKNVAIRRLAKSHIFLIILFLALSAGMIAGYTDILPYFVRGAKISLSDSLLNPTSIQCWISTLLPFSIVKNSAFYDTDISMRNCYFSLTLSIFFLLCCFSKKVIWQKYLLFVGLFFVFLSTGGIFKSVAYKFIPLMGYVRLNGEFRIFSLLCFIVAASIELNKFVKGNTYSAIQMKWIYRIIETILMVLILFGIYESALNKQSVFFILKNIEPGNLVSVKIKIFLDGITLYDTLWIQGIIQMLFLQWIKTSLNKRNWGMLKKIVVIEMIFASLFNIPFTGAGKTSVHQVQAVLNKSPKGIPAPIVQPILSIAQIPLAESELTGDWSMYNKQIGVSKEVPYPIALRNTAYYLQNCLTNRDSNFLRHPFVFIPASTNTDSIKVGSFSPNKVAVFVKVNAASAIVFQQTFYPHWFYTNDGIKKPMLLAGVNFMAGALHKGSNQLTFSFEPTLIMILMLSSAILFVVYLLILLMPFLMHCFRSLKKHNKIFPASQQSR